LLDFSGSSGWRGSSTVNVKNKNVTAVHIVAGLRESRLKAEPCPLPDSRPNDLAFEVNGDGFVEVFMIACRRLRFWQIAKDSRAVNGSPCRQIPSVHFHVSGISETWKSASDIREPVLEPKID